MKGLARLAGLVLLTLVVAPAARAQQDPWSACARAIAAAERGSGLPQGMLLAIATVESGRRNPETRQVQPWPWTWNAAGESGYAETRSEAATAINALLAGGTRSIDVGCMQVNLLHHQDAFAHVEEALDPTANVAYAIRFLRQLHARTGSWAQAIAEYHSATPWRGAAYHQRVVSAGRGTGLDAGGAVALPAGVAAGLCSPGLTAALLTTPQRAATPTAGRRDAAARPAPAPTAQRTRIICMGPRIELAAALPLPPVSVPIPRGGLRAAPRGGDPALLPLPPAARPAQARQAAAQPRPASPAPRGQSGFFVPGGSYYPPSYSVYR